MDEPGGLASDIRSQWQLARREFDTLRPSSHVHTIGRLEKPAEAPQRPMSHDDVYRSLPMTPKTRERVRELSLQKEEIVKQNFEKYDDWRRSIREQVVDSISSKVGQRLDTPPEEKARRTQQMLRHKFQQKIQEIEEAQRTLEAKPGDDWKKRFGTAAPRANDVTRGVNVREHGGLSTHESNGDIELPERLHPEVTKEPVKEPEPTPYELRVKKFSKFNKDGFREALRRGDVIEGSRRGHFKDDAGIVLTGHGPFWPVGFGPMFPTPSHITPDLTSPEPLWTPESNTCVPEEDRRTLLRHPGPWTVAPVLVYDSTSTEHDQPTHEVPGGCGPSLAFESRFESGNLHRAYRVGNFEYELHLKPDLFTERHTQWFYFRVTHTVPGVNYTFRIVNFTKCDSLYSHGMRPLFYSETEASSKRRPQGWIRAGQRISYTQTCDIASDPHLNDSSHYMLTWSIQFAHRDDTCYLAHCYPYPFSRLRDYLDTLAERTHRLRIFRKDILCESRARNTCYLLTITSSQVPDGGKKAVVLTARVHPGETNSSWVLEGFLDFITSMHPMAQALRAAFIFKVVPMLNPDGVIVGNYRCSLFGRDMNRNYRRPKRDLFPTIWHVKNLIQRTQQRNQILLYVDLHGHSRNHNVFMYGCDASYMEGEVEPPDGFLNERLFPFLMSIKGPEVFSFSKSKFHVRRSKESTGRVVVFRQFNLLNSFTMESSFCGNKSTHFDWAAFKRVGALFGDALHEYMNIMDDQLAQQKYILELTRAIAHQLIDGGTCGEFGSRDGGQGRGQAERDRQRAVAEVTELLAKTKSLKDCLRLLESLKRPADQQTESDDSDSTSESEFVDPRAAAAAAAKASKKSKAVKHRRSREVTGKKVEVSSVKQSERPPVNLFNNPYANRSGGGFPIFTEERIKDKKKCSNGDGKGDGWKRQDSEKREESTENDRASGDRAHNQVTVGFTHRLTHHPSTVGSGMNHHAVISSYPTDNSPPDTRPVTCHDSHKRSQSDLYKRSMTPADLGHKRSMTPSQTDLVHKRSMTPIKNLFIDAFGDLRHLSNRPSTTTTTTPTLPPQNTVTSQIAAAAAGQTSSHSLAMRTLVGKPDLYRNSTISYYIKKK